MSRTGNPYDNAKAERFMRMLKYEEIYMNDYEHSPRYVPRSSISSKRFTIESDFTQPSAAHRRSSLKLRGATETS